MRTTLTIEDSIDKRLKTIAHKTGKSYKQVVNDTLRAGLIAPGVREQARPYKLKPAAMGEVSAHYDLDKALTIAEDLEDAEIAGKLALRK
jgi:predicted transcriptional regulator